MNLNELYRMLEMESPADMEYFEQLAELMESDEDISRDMFGEALSEVTPENAGELVGNYLNELSQSLPEGDWDEIFESLANMEQRLMLLSEDVEEPSSREDFINELYKLRSWLKGGGAKINGEPASVLDAFTEMRSAKLGLSDARVDFSSAPPLMPEELSFRIGRFERIEL